MKTLDTNSPFCSVGFPLPHRIGLGFELQRAEFILDNDKSPTAAEVKIDGQLATTWHFEVHTGVLNHTVSVAYGPIEWSVSSVKSALGYPGAMKPSNPMGAPKRIIFRELTIEELIS